MPTVTPFSLLGCRALITGASSGLGAEFARQLAPKASALWLVARRVELLQGLREELQATHPSLMIEVLVCDLCDPRARRELVEGLRQRACSINVLINNAGMGDYGSVATAQWSKLEAMMQLNMLAVVELSHGLMPLLEAHAPARILQGGSLAGSMPLPEFALYAASKGFVQQFSEALAIECCARGVGVTCLCPGPTATEFSRQAKREQGADTDRRGHGLLRQPPARVVALALEGMRRADPCVHPGLAVWLLSRVCRLLPVSLLRAVLRWRYQSH